MSRLTAAREDILDLEGQPLLADGTIFLKTLDRLLTVGSYYAADHYQYLAAVQKGCSALLRAIEPRSALAVEITASGVLILDQTVDPNHLHTRKLYGLLVALNIARLEFRNRLSSQDLHTALEQLKQHRIDLEKSDGFREVSIDGLPDSVSIATRLIGNKDGEGLLDELLGGLEEHEPPGRSPGPEQSQKELARAFMDLAEQLMTNLESTLDRDPEAAPAELLTAVSPEELASIREGLSRLLEKKPDPADILRLIKHARMAVDLSQDPRTVDLAFKILRGDMGVQEKRGNQQNRWVLQEDLSFSADALHQAVLGLEYAPLPVAQAGESARCDQLAVAFTLLGWELESREKSRVLGLVEGVLKSEACGVAEMAVIARGMKELAGAEQKDGENKTDRWLSAALRLVRQQRPYLLAGLWADVLHATDGMLYENLWPHLVNDLLLGFPQESGLETGSLWARAGEASMGQARNCLPRLKGLPALGTSAREPDTSDLLALPLERTRPLHAVLMKSRFADRHGPHLLRALRRQPGQDWIQILVTSLEEYSPEHRKLFFALICEADLPRPTERLREMAGLVLITRLETLPRPRRAEDWVAPAVALLPSLLGQAARPLLDRVCRERRFIFYRAWPAICREMAWKARDGMKTRTDGEGH